MMMYCFFFFPILGVLRWQLCMTLQKVSLSHMSIPYANSFFCWDSSLCIWLYVYQLYFCVITSFMEQDLMKSKKYGIKNDELLIIT